MNDQQQEPDLPEESHTDEEEEYDGDGWCMTCGDEFHLDDIGGYNPPCSCGFHCRSCHEAEEADEEDYDWRDEDYDEDYEDAQ